MTNLLKITAFLLLCASFAAAQYHDHGDPNVKRPMLEFANHHTAKIAWTSRHGMDDVLEYSTNPENYYKAVDAVERMGGDNHRASLVNLRPNTTYYVRMTDKSGRPLGPVFTFRTTAPGQPDIHEVPLGQ
jgi:Purple acid Phosphatase, N-terminal domain